MEEDQLASIKQIGFDHPWSARYLTITRVSSLKSCSMFIVICYHMIQMFIFHVMSSDQTYGWVGTVSPICDWSALKQAQPSLVINGQWMNWCFPRLRLVGAVKLGMFGSDSDSFRDN